MILPRAQLQGIIQGLSGLSGYAVFWEHDPNPPTNSNDQGQVRLTLKSMTTRGIDERRDEYDPLNDAIVSKRYGLRDLVISVRASTYTRQAEALEICDRIRGRLLRPSTIQALNAVSLAYQSADPAVDLPTVEDSRVVSTANMDLHFTGILSEVVSGEESGFVETVNGTNAVTLEPLPLTFSGEAQGSSSATLTLA